MTLRLILGVAALTGLCACGHNNGRSEQEPRNYVMRNLRKAEQVSCSWVTLKTPTPPPVREDPALPRDCIALCMRAGFHGEDKELEQAVGYGSPVPDRKTQISMNIPQACQM